MLEVMGLEGSDLPIAATLLSTEVQTTEKERKCPICSQKMKKVVMGQEPHILIDGCPEGDGFWFDGGELKELITQYGERSSDRSDSQERILTFLGDTFRVGNGLA